MPIFTNPMPANEAYDALNGLFDPTASNAHDHSGSDGKGKKINSSDVINTPAGNISATTVQAAINELDIEKIATSYLDTDVTLAASSDTKIATQKAAKTYVDNKIIVSTTAEAQAGTENTKLITPLRLREGLHASGDAPIFACRAWVNFNGTGTVTIRASGNVSSVTDNGTGDYTVNLTTAMPDTNFAVVPGVLRSTTSFDGKFITAYPSSTSTIRVFTGSSVSTTEDEQYINLAVFR